jgi:hypothetical protein
VDERHRRLAVRALPPRLSAASPTRSCRYVYPSEIATFGSSDARAKMLATGRLGRTWAANYTTASRLPLHPAMGPANTPYPPSAGDTEAPAPLTHAALSFVHGGLAPAYPALAPFPAAINALGETLLRKLQTQKPLPRPHPPGPYPGLPADATEAEHRFASLRVQPRKSRLN